MVAVAGDMRVALKWIDDDGRTAFNVLHFKGIGADLTADAMLTSILVGPGSAALGPVTGHAAVKEITVTNMFDLSDTAVATTGLTEWTGGGDTADYSIGLSAVLRFHTAFGGRSGKGRAFLPFLTESAVAKGRIIGDALTATAPAWKTWFDALNSGEGWEQTVWSEKTLTGHAVTSYALNPIPGFRRKRANEA